VGQGKNKNNQDDLLKAGNLLMHIVRRYLMQLEFPESSSKGLIMITRQYASVHCLETFCNFRTE